MIVEEGASTERGPLAGVGELAAAPPEPLRMRDDLMVPRTRPACCATGACPPPRR
ncbi:hypothetical protein [Nonomuraea sp. NPDC005650]|uniref:hypothetical protein n=1 Tax=Nonomuraea sp. NPDC005650 TaxID=3157045 RepID=UPI0033AB257A